MTENNEDKSTEELTQDVNDFIAKIFAPMNMEVTNMNEQPKQIIDEEYMKNKKVDGPTLQIRTLCDGGTGMMHLQGYGEVSINRDYGFAAKYAMPHDVGMYLAALKPKFQSFATDSVAYVRNVTVEKYNDGYQLVISGSNNADMIEGIDNIFKFNFSNQWRLDMHFQLCNELIDFVEQNNTYIQCEGKRPTQGVETSEE
tara:strand:+ start:909 stop:1505 length:597 start_codon:yes stop_codon:yes gene_type:complete